MDKQDLIHNAAVEAAKGAPPASVAITSQVQGWTMANTVTALTMLYLVLQIAWLVWQWRQASRNKDRAAQADKKAAPGKRHG